MMSLARAVTAVLASGLPWPSDAVRGLAKNRWDELAACGVDPGNYGTLRVLAGRADAPRVTVATYPAPADGYPDVVIERLGDTMPSTYIGLGIHEVDLVPERLASALDAAFAMLRLAPDAAFAVAALVRSLHLLATDGPAYDTSFSDPDVPFSVFVGVHPEPVRNDALRLAEGLLHEAMHLQLTLAERHVPLVAGADERRHSPWQDRERPMGGLLHALYVFRAIQRFLSQALNGDYLDEDDRRYASSRIKEIKQQIDQVAELESSGDLTAAGRRVAAALLHSTA